MIIFADKNLTKPLKELELGILKAGETKKFIFHIHNETKANLRNLKMFVPHNEVNIIKAPVNIGPMETQDLIVQWNPSVDIKEPLKTTLKVTGEELYG